MSKKIDFSYGGRLFVFEGDGGDGTLRVGKGAEANEPLAQIFFISRTIYKVIKFKNLVIRNISSRSEK